MKKLHIEELGFKKVFPDEVDKKYFFWRKNISHKHIRGLHIIVDQKINVYCKDLFSKGNEALLCQSKSTIENLEEILKSFEKY